MKPLISVPVALALATAPTLAGERYDHKLEEAAMRIVAENIGDIRGGFSYKQKPRFVIVQDALRPDAGSLPGPGAKALPSIIGTTDRPKS
jgi:hypothetical protein